MEQYFLESLLLPQTRLEAGDAVVLFGAPQDLGRAEQRLIVKPLP